MVTTGTNHERTNQTTKPGVLATPRFSFFFSRGGGRTGRHEQTSFSVFLPVFCSSFSLLMTLMTNDFA
jgi:hypothetical protein